MSEKEENSPPRNVVALGHRDKRPIKLKRHAITADGRPINPHTTALTSQTGDCQGFPVFSDGTTEACSPPDKPKGNVVGLPAADPERAAAAALRQAWRADVKAGRSKPKVLLVEPYPRLRKTLRDALEAQGCEVVVSDKLNISEVGKQAGVNGTIRPPAPDYKLIVFGEKRKDESAGVRETYRPLLNNRFSVPVLFITGNAALKNYIDEGQHVSARCGMEVPFVNYIDSNIFTQRKQGGYDPEAVETMIYSALDLMEKGLLYEVGNYVRQ